MGIRGPAALVSACASGIIQGYGLCVIAPLITPLQRSLQLCYPCGDESDAALARCTCFEKSLAVSSVTLGAVVGGLFGGFAADRYGRRAVLMTTDVLLLGSVALTVLPGEVLPVQWFFVGRVLCGVALGGAGAAASAYVAEVASTRTRGRWLTVVELGLCIGCLSAYITATVVGDARWRGTVVSLAIPVAAQLVALVAVVVESPRWLVGRGRPIRAARNAAILGTRMPGTSARMLPGDQSPAGLLAHLVADAGAVLTAVGCAVAHSATAANTVLYFSRDIIELADVKGNGAATIGIGAVKLVGVVVAICLVDRFGRRRLLLVGSVGMIAGHLGLAFVSARQPVNGLAALTFLLVFILSWNLSW